MYMYLVRVRAFVCVCMYNVHVYAYYEYLYLLMNNYFKGSSMYYAPKVIKFIKTTLPYLAMK